MLTNTGTKNEIWRKITIQLKEIDIFIIDS